MLMSEIDIKIGCVSFWTDPCVHTNVSKEDNKTIQDICGKWEG